MKRLIFLLVFLVSPFAHAQVQIHEPAVVRIRPNQATIEWTTNAPTTAKIEFGTSTKLNRFVRKKSLSSGHTVTLEKLRPNKQYFFRIKAQDKKGQISLSTIYSFRTAAKGNNDERTLKLLSSPQVTHISPTKIILSWETNKPSTSLITYGFKKQRKPKSYFSERKVAAHIITLDGLTANTRYYYKVKSKDELGKTVSSIYTSFLTEKSTKGKTKPAVVDGPAISRRRADAFRVDWNTNRPCKSYITWGKVPLASFHKRKEVAKRFTTTHSFELSGLKEGFHYYYIIHLEDLNGRKSKSEVFAIQTEKFY